MGQKPSSPTASRDAFGVVPSAPPKACGRDRRPPHQPAPHVADPPSRKERLAVCAPIMSAIRPWLFVAGHGVQWPEESYSLINLASEVPFLEDNPPPDHIRRVLTLALRDGATQEIVPFFPRVLAAVQAALSTEHKVIVLCQQGVSRSCATAIAILMCWESLSYEQAFRQVKAARDVCSPNAGFICQLMELHAQRLDPTKRPRVFRYVPHGLHDLATLVLKPCWLSELTRVHAAPSQVRRRSIGIFVYPATATTVYLWRGQDTTDADAASATEELHKWYLHLWSESNLPSVQVEREGTESSAFLLWVQLSPSDGTSVDYDDVTWTTPPLGRQDVDTPAANTDLESAPSSMKPQFRVMESADDEAWELLREYDSSDLLSHQVGWLHVPGECDYIWIGNACDSAWTQEVLVQKVQSDSTVRAGPITFVRDREESEEFWNAFELGY